MLTTTGPADRPDTLHGATDMTLTNKDKRAIRRLCRNPRLFSRLHRDDHLVARAQLAKRIGQLAENGRIAVVEAGMDCDGVRYSGHSRTLPASVIAVEHWDRDQNEWADGPRGFYVERPSVARSIAAERRDLALEAFEDGHPHVLYA